MIFEMIIFWIFWVKNIRFRITPVTHIIFTLDRNALQYEKRHPGQ